MSSMGMKTKDVEKVLLKTFKLISIPFVFLRVLNGRKKQFGVSINIQTQNVDSYKIKRNHERSFKNGKRKNI